MGFLATPKARSARSLASASTPASRRSSTATSSRAELTDFGTSGLA